MIKPFKVNISDQVLEAIYAKVKKYPWHEMRLTTLCVNRRGPVCPWWGQIRMQAVPASELILVRIKDISLCNYLFYS